MRDSQADHKPRPSGLTRQTNVNCPFASEQSSDNTLSLTNLIYDHAADSHEKQTPNRLFML